MPECDQIVFMENGSLIETGTYTKLIENGGEFNEFIKSFLETKETNVENISKLFVSKNF